MAIVYTGGTFDLFHSGHVNLLRQCKDIATNEGSVVVSLNTDEFILEYKGKKPICSYDERAEVLQACRYVDQVIPNVGGADSKTAILQVMPDYIVIGSDWETRDYYAQMQFSREWLVEKDIILKYVPYTENISTTDLKQRVL